MLHNNAFIVGKRELKKAAHRASIIEHAHRLFEERGFDNVAVLEIAKAAGVSVKTLFQYFRTKEDLVFAGEMALIEEITEAILKRKEGMSLYKAAISALLDLIRREDQDALSQLEGFARMTDNPVLKSRLQMMWLNYEDYLAKAIAEALGSKLSDVKPRLFSIQIIGLLRSITSEEVRVHLTSERSTRLSLEKWLKTSAQFLSQDLQDYGIQ